LRSGGAGDEEADDSWKEADAGTHGNKQSTSVRRGSEPLPDPKELVRLQRESPPRMGRAVRHGGRDVALEVGAVHRLQGKVREIELRVRVGRGALLRIHELEFVTVSQ